MNQTPDTLKKFGKKALTACVGVVAACSIALSALVSSPDELFSGTAQAAQVAIIQSDEDRAGTSPVALPAQKETLRERLRRLFLAQPSVVRGVVLLPFWAAGKVALSLISLLVTALSPILQLILGVLFNALLLFGLFALVLKLLFPNLRLRDLFTKRTIILLAVASILLSVTDAILRASWEDYRPISIAIKLGVGLLVLALLSWRIFGKRVPRAAATA